MGNTEKSTEQKILKAAREVFVKKGYAASTMQEIADEAGINKSLLHYYFRSKDRLFGAIFKESFSQFMPRVGEIFMDDIPFFDKISKLVDHYIDLLKDNPHIPGFILHELNRNPDKVVSLFKEIGINPEMLITLFKREVQKGSVVNLEPHHFMVNLFSLCIFPFIAKPILNVTILKEYDNDFNIFIEERKKVVSEFIINAISK